MSADIFYAVFLLGMGGLLGTLIAYRFPVRKETPLPDLQTQLESLRSAHNELVKEVASKSPMKISRVENKELFDRIEALEKADRTPVVRHEHYYTELPKGKPPKAEKGLGSGVSKLFPETNI